MYSPNSFNQRIIDKFGYQEAKKMVEKGMIVLRCNEAYRELVKYRKMKNMEPRVVQIEDEEAKERARRQLEESSLLWQPLEFGLKESNGVHNQSFGKAKSRLR